MSPTAGPLPHAHLSRCDDPSADDGEASMR